MAGRGKRDAQEMSPFPSGQQQLTTVLHVGKGVSGNVAVSDVRATPYIPGPNQKEKDEACIMYGDRCTNGVLLLLFVYYYLHTLPLDVSFLYITGYNHYAFWYLHTIPLGVPFCILLWGLLPPLSGFHPSMNTGESSTYVSNQSIV